MPISYIYNKLIREELEKLKKPVQLTLVTNGRQELNENLKSTLDIYVKYSKDLLRIEEISNNNEEYLPALLFINKKGFEVIRYLANPFGAEIKPFAEALIIFSGESNYFERVVKEKIEFIKPSVIKVMITSSCAYCPEIVSFVNKFAIASNGRIKSEIIDIMAHPEIGESYEVSNVPSTIINEEKKFQGIVGPNEVLQELLRGK